MENNNLNQPGSGQTPQPQTPKMPPGLVNPAQQAKQPAQQPAQTVQQPAAQTAAQPATQPAQAQIAAQPAAQPAQAQAAQKQPQQASKAALPKDQSKSNKRLLLGCLGAFGCSILLFIGVLFAFLAFGSTDNPIFGFLGAPSGEVVNVLITLVNFIFLILVFLTFIFLVVGMFKFATAKKEDKEAKRRGSVFTLVSLSLMVVFIFVWIVAYYFLASKRTVVTRTPIATVPERTINLTAPVTISFDASRAPVNRNQFDILGYEWDFGDKTEVRGNPQTHTFTEVGNYVVKLTIMLKEKAGGKEQQVEFTRDVTIQNALANVIIRTDESSGEAPFTVNLDGSDSRSPNGEILAYAWDLDEDGMYDDGTATTAEVTFSRVGKFKVGLRVTDSTLAFATGSAEIDVLAPNNPVAVIKVDGLTGSSTLLESGKAYMFLGGDSVSPSGNIEKYEWTFGDGGRSNTRSATHTFRDPGEYEVSLRVTDSQRSSAETSQKFTVAPPNSPPLVSLKTTPEASNNIVTGQAPFDVIFDASQSQDANNNIIEYSWDFDGDGSADDANAVTSHRYENPGTYNVSLTVTDATELSTRSQIVVQVESPGLRAQLTADPVAGIVPLTVRFDASGSSYPDGNIVNYEWDFGDGALPRTDTATVSHQYTAVGTFNAKVTAITSDGKRSQAQVSINVRSVPVNACFEPSVIQGRAPLEVEFDPTCSTGTVVRYNWNIGGLRQSSERKPAYTFRSPGVYDVSLEVADSQNVVDTFTSRITINE